MKGKVTAPFRPPRVAQKGPTQIALSAEREADETALSDSEEPTELGLVWDVGQLKGGCENTFDLSPVRASKAHDEDSDLPSPHLADFESFLSIMEDKQRKSPRCGTGDAFVSPQVFKGGPKSKRTARSIRQRPTSDKDQVDNSPTTARQQRHRRLDELKKINISSTFIPESQPPEAIVGVPLSDDDDDDIPIALQLSKPFISSAVVDVPDITTRSRQCGRY
jgi:hypothetical protein